MVLDHREKQITNHNLLLLLKDIGYNDMQFKLLCFWKHHPRAKLSLCTVARALDTQSNSLRAAITALCEKGILTVQHNSNGLTTYVISQQRGQEYIAELTRIDWSEVMDLRRRLKEETLSPGNDRKQNDDYIIDH